jgi:hypothetical protein
MESFIYGVPRDIRKCLVCHGPTFFYEAYKLTWSYCTLCRVFYTPCREREIGKFLVQVKKALDESRQRA